MLIECKWYVSYTAEDYCLLCDERFDQLSSYCMAQKKFYVHLLMKRMEQDYWLSILRDKLGEGAAIFISCPNDLLLR